MLGKTISHYQIVEKIGEGGMGQVYKAWDGRLNRHVAIKVLPADKVSDNTRRERFLREARAASALNHPNIVTIYDIVSEGGQECLVMECIAGQTLAGILGRGPMPIPTVLDIAAQIADALATAHEAGIVHRDLKPGNVMLTSSGHVKLLDFGLAKLVQMGPTSDDTNTQTSAESLTMLHSIIGTPRYMSPEQAEGNKLDARSDVFTFGVLLYEMLTGQVAFEAPTSLATLTAVLRDEPKPISVIVPHAPQELVDLIQRCMRKHPDARYQYMRVVHHALRNIAGHLPPAAKIEVAPSLVGTTEEMTVLFPPHSTQGSDTPAAPRTIGAATPAATRTKSAPTLAVAALIAAVTFGGVYLATKGRQPPALPTESQPPTAIEEKSPSDDTSATAPTAPASPRPATKPAAPAQQPDATPVPPAAVTVPPVPSSPAAIAVTLKDATPVQLSLSTEITDAAEKGDKLALAALYDVVVDGIVVVAKGAAGKATIADGSRRKALIGKTDITMLFDSVDAIDGTPVRLRENSRLGAERKPRIAGKLVGKDGRSAIAAGAQYVAYVDGDVVVKAAKR